jgi:hypothetical protein
LKLQNSDGKFYLPKKMEIINSSYRSISPLLTPKRWSFICVLMGELNGPLPRGGCRPTSQEAVDKFNIYWKEEEESPK